jgi:zinc/manganese transport system permease protein
VIGLLASYHLNLAAGPTIILAGGVIYLLSMAFGSREGLVWKAFPNRHLSA